MDWKAEISRIVYWKQIIADNDKLHAYPWHLPRVGATADVIARAESAAGAQFSPQFEELLRHADGWPGFFITVDLFGTKEFLDGRHKRVLERPELLAFLDGLGLKEDEAIPIGATDYDLDVFLHISPRSKMLPGGVIWFANEEVERFGSVAEFFSSMVNHNAAIADRLAAKAT